MLNCKQNLITVTKILDSIGAISNLKKDVLLEKMNQQLRLFCISGNKAFSILCFGRIWVVFT